MIVSDLTQFLLIRVIILSSDTRGNIFHHYKLINKLISECSRRRRSPWVVMNDPGILVMFCPSPGINPNPLESEELNRYVHNSFSILGFWEVRELPFFFFKPFSFFLSD